MRCLGSSWWSSSKAFYYALDNFFLICSSRKFIDCIPETKIDILANLLVPKWSCFIQILKSHQAQGLGSIFLALCYKNYACKVPNWRCLSCSCTLFFQIFFISIRHKVFNANCISDILLLLYASEEVQNACMISFHDSSCGTFTLSRFNEHVRNNGFQVGKEGEINLQ